MTTEALDEDHFTTWDVLKPLGVRAALFLPNEPITPLNSPQVLRLIVSATISGSSSGETLLNSLFKALWPKKSSPELIWAGFHEPLRGLVRNLVGRGISEDQLRQVEGLFPKIKRLLDENDQSLKTLHFKDLLASITALQSSFPEEDENPEKSAPLFIPLGTLHLALLWSQWKFPEEIHDIQDISYDQHRKDLEEALAKYTDVIARGRTEILEWRKGQIEEPDIGTWSWVYLVGDEVTITDHFTGESEYFQWATGYNYQDEVKWEAMYDNLKYAVDNKYTAELDEIFAPTLIWDLFKPDNEVESVKHQFLIHPGWIGNGKHISMDWFDHRALFELHGSITKLVIHADDVLYGLEVFYGDQSAGLRGAKKGSEHVIHVGSQESITKVAGSVGEKTKNVERLDFTKRSQNLDDLGRIGDFGNPETVTGGRGEINYSHEGAGENHRYWNRLMWFSGWSSNGKEDGHIQMLWPVFGYRQDFLKDGTGRRC